MTQSLARMFEVPEWFDGAEATEDAELFSHLRLRGIYSVAGTLGLAEKLGGMPENISDIYEFGSGYGEGLVALDMLARARGGAEVRGSEKSMRPHHLSRQLAEMILPNVAGIDGNGISGLNNRPESFDVVLANMFGPSYTDELLPSRFIPAALKALRLGGVIIMNSDPQTMFQVYKWSEKNLAPGQLQEITNDKLPNGFGRIQPHSFIRK